MCKQLALSRAGYYKWLHHEPSLEEVENEQIKEYNETYKSTLRYRRMRNYINRNKRKFYSKGRIHRIMQVPEFKSVIRKKKKTYRRSTAETTAENVLHRDFETTRPNEKWGTDVIEFKVPMSSKKVYLSAIVNLYDKSIVSYVLSNHNNNKLVFDTYNLALVANPEAAPLFHSDRGYQYTSSIFRQKLREQGMIQSMSRVKFCIHNGPIVGIW